MCLNDAQDLVADGNPVQISTCAPGDAQSWALVDGALVGPGAKCLTASTPAVGGASIVYLSACTGSALQQWTYAANALTTSAGACLEVRDEQTNDGAALTVDSCSAPLAPAQTWWFGVAGSLTKNDGAAGSAPLTVHVTDLPTHVGCSAPAAGSAAWSQTCAGYSEGSIVFPVTGRYQFDVAAAHADASSTSVPELQLGIDGTYAPERQANVEWSSVDGAGTAYTFLAYVEAGPHLVEVRSANPANASAAPDHAVFGTLKISNPAPPPPLDVVPDQYWNAIPLTWYPVNDAPYPAPFAALDPGASPGQATVHAGASGGPRQGDTGSWEQGSSGYSELLAVFPNAGSYDFDVWAYGDTFLSAPRLALSVDGQAVGVVDVIGTAAAKYSFTGSVSAGQHLVEVSLLNDFASASAPAGDRNLVVASVDITEVGLEPGTQKLENGLNGQYAVGAYSYGAESTSDPAGSIQGQSYGFDGSLVFASPSVIPSSTRNYYVYVPAQVDRTKPAAFMVFQDGMTFCDPNGPIRVPIVFDKLIAEGAMPPTIAVCVSPGQLSKDSAACQAGDDDCFRSFQYDSVNDTYWHLLTDELLPHIAQQFGLVFSSDPDQRGIGGASSGGSAALAAGWFHSESFRKIYTSSGSFTDIRHHGANAYPAMITAEPSLLPLRISLVAGTHDFDCFGNVGADCQGDPHAWADANKRVAAALNAQKYPYQFVFGTETHVGALAATDFPNALRWLWSK